MSNDSGVVDDDILRLFRWLLLRKLERRPASSAVKDQQESLAVAWKPHDATVKFYKDYVSKFIAASRGNSPCIAWLSCYYTDPVRLCVDDDVLAGFLQTYSTE